MAADRIAVFCGALLGLGVLLIGATQNHDMHTMLSVADIRSYDTAIRYQMFQALALLALGALSGKLRYKLYRVVPYLWMLGALLFCGSIYLRVLAGVEGIGLVTPVGGALMILGWAVILVVSLQWLGKRKQGKTS